jgi:urease accessory protein
MTIMPFAIGQVDTPPRNTTCVRPVMPRTHGDLELRFVSGKGDQATKLQIEKQHPPLRVVRAFSVQDGAALVHLHNISGGVLGGDRLDLTVQVDDHAQAQITSTGSTRVYRHRAPLPPAAQVNRFTVGQNGLLEYLPDSIIPFAHSRFQQETHITLAAGAGLFYWEIVAPGREARGERCLYDHLQFKLDIETEDRPIAIERTRLEPALRPLTSPVRLGAYAYFATLYICRVGLPDGQWQDLESQLGDMALGLTLPEHVLWGVSTLPAHGVVVRALSRSSWAIVQDIARFWRAAKLALYEKPAEMPRKLY